MIRITLLEVYREILKFYSKFFWGELICFFSGGYTLSVVRLVVRLASRKAGAGYLNWNVVMAPRAHGCWRHIGFGPVFYEVMAC